MRVKIQAEDLTADSLVFATVLDLEGVASIPPEMAKAAEAAAQCIGRQIVNWEGDPDYTRALFDRPVEEAEADSLCEKLIGKKHLS